MGTSFDGCELLRSNDEAEETASSPLFKIIGIGSKNSSGRGQLQK